MQPIVSRCSGLLLLERLSPSFLLGQSVIYRLLESFCIDLLMRPLWMRLSMPFFS